MNFTDIIKSDKPILFDFYADWCAPCRMMKPILEELKSKMGDDVLIYKINVDNNQALSNQFQIRSIPTLMIFLDGQPVWQRAGITSAPELEKTIKGFVTAKQA